MNEVESGLAPGGERAGALLLQAQPGGPDFTFFLMLGVIFAIFYFLVIRPENQKRQEHEDAVKAAGKGDTVTTTGGLKGKITGATDDVVTVEIAHLKSGEAIKVKVAREAISKVEKEAS